MDYDFGGWATRNDLRCSDGLTIVRDAFKHNDGKKVPLIWNHEHNDPTNVLGHATLENRNEGVYAYCTFNSTPAGQSAREMVSHGDIDALSIYANQLKKNGDFVMHGQIREVSLVLAGANPGAFIDSVMVHGMTVDGEGVIYTGETIELTHSEGGKNMPPVKPQDEGQTIQEVFDTFSEEQKNVVYALIGAAMDEENNDGGDGNMKHNVFNDNNAGQEGDVLTHSDMMAVLDSAKRYGSLKDAVIAHGIDHMDFLFPDFKSVNETPDFIQRPNGWVDQVLSSVHHTPFSRIKSIFANITADDARAKGYIKGNRKQDEVFGLLKRTTSPTTIYKKQKLDRDDVVDITDFEVVGWLKAEMRMMLNEEIARAVLTGDGRAVSSDDKINEQCIRPIWKDDELFTIKSRFDVKGLDGNAKAKAFIKNAVKSRKDYKGSGEPTLYTTEDVLTDMLLIEDTTGRIIYDTVDKLKSQLRVKDIITVPTMEHLTRVDGATTLTLGGIIVNLGDYNIGADKGGAVSMFDDFDIDYNAQKYLIETRCSGALVKPYSAIVIESFTS